MRTFKTITAIMRTTGLMYVHRRAQEEEEGNAAAVMLPMEKVLQLKAVKVVSRTIISPSSPESGLQPFPKTPANHRQNLASVFQRSQQIIVRRFQRQSLSLACR